MKKSVLAIMIFSFLLIFSAVASAEWNGTEKQEFINIWVPVSDGVSISGTLNHFQVHEACLDQWYYYFGPEFVVTEDFWISPKIGAVTNWFDEDAFLVSVFAGLNYNNWAVFLEHDRIFNGDLKGRYGYYSLSYNFSNSLFAGPRVEQVNADFWFGIGLGINKEIVKDVFSWTSELTFWKFTEGMSGYEAESVRWVNTFNLF